MDAPHVDAPSGEHGPAQRSGGRRITAAKVQRKLGLRSRFLAERLLFALDPWNAGFRSVADLRRVAQTLVDAPLERKLAFLFRLHDQDGDGLLDRDELDRMIHIGLAEHGIVLPAADTHRLLDALLDDADLDHDGRLTFEDFRRIVERRPELEARLAACGVAMLQPKPRAKRRAMVPSRAEALGWVRYWGVLGTWLAAFVMANVWLFADAVLEYRNRGANEWIQLARGCGACLNLDGPLLLVPMLRHLWTGVRRTRIRALLPLDETIGAHKLLGETVFGLSVVHAVAHLANVWQSGAPLWTTANITGLALLWLLGIMWLFARERVRAAGHFELFHWIHASYWLWFALAVMHGPVLWTWLVLPGVGFVLEQILRLVLRHRPTELLEARPLPSGVTMLRFRRPAGFEYQPGDFVFLCVPAIAKREWHPFTLTSAPEDPDVLSVHIRSLGNWTAAVREQFTVPGRHREHRVYVDGPYGTPTAHVDECRHVVTIAAGIGVTPFASVLRSLQARRLRGDVRLLTERLHFVWISREQASFEWFTHLLAELEAHNDERWLDLHIYFTTARDDLDGSAIDLARTILHDHTGVDLITGLRARTQFGRPDLEALLHRFADEPDLPAPAVFFCGPPVVSRELRRICGRLNLEFRYERF